MSQQQYASDAQQLASRRSREEAERRNTSASATPASAGQDGFNSPDYQRAKGKVISIIPTVSILDAIDRYIGHVVMGLFGFALTRMFTGDRDTPGFRRDAVRDPWVLAPMITGFAAACLGIYAHFRKRQISEPAHIDHQEEMMKVDAGLFGNEVGKGVARSMKEYMGAAEGPTKAAETSCEDGKSCGQSCAHCGQSSCACHGKSSSAPEHSADEEKNALPGENGQGIHGARLQKQSQETSASLRNPGG